MPPTNLNVEIQKCSDEVPSFRFCLAIETTRCVPIISLCILETPRGHERGHCVSTGKSSVDRGREVWTEEDTTDGLTEKVTLSIKVPVLPVPRRSSACQ